MKNFKKLLRKKKYETMKEGIRIMKNSDELNKEKGKTT